MRGSRGCGGGSRSEGFPAHDAVLSWPRQGSNFDFVAEREGQVRECVHSHVPGTAQELGNVRLGSPDEPGEKGVFGAMMGVGARALPNALRPCNLRGRDAIALLPESVRDHRGSARLEIAGHSNLETLELEKVRVLDALKVFPIADLPLFAHVVKEGVHLGFFRVVKLAVAEVPTGRGAIGADRVHNGHRRTSTGNGPAHSLRQVNINVNRPRGRFLPRKSAQPSDHTRQRCRQGCGGGLEIPRVGGKAQFTPAEAPESRVQSPSVSAR